MPLNQADKDWISNAIRDAIRDHAAAAVWGAEVGRGDRRRTMSQALTELPTKIATAVWGAWFGRGESRETAIDKLNRAATRDDA